MFTNSSARPKLGAESAASVTPAIARQRRIGVLNDVLVRALMSILLPLAGSPGAFGALVESLLSKPHARPAALAVQGVTAQEL